MRLLERGNDLATLVAQWDRAKAGRGGLVIVNGEPGAGKSTLLQAFTDECVGDVPVLWSACDPLSTPRPLGPIHDLADRLGEETQSLLRTARQPHEIFAAVFEHLRLHPSVLVVDDLHWADQGTIDLLRFLLRRLRITHSLLVGAVRDDEIDVAHPLRSLLGDAARSADATSTALRPLTVDAIGMLIDGREIDPVKLKNVTGGNPFFVVEMLDYHGDEIPSTVRDAILARTTGLSAEAWDLLHLLACAPETIPDRLLAHLGIGLPPLRTAADAGLIRREPRGVAFRHDLCRIAISDTIPPGGEVSLHRRMLDALESSTGADPAVLVHHAVGAGDSARTLRYAADAGRAAARSGAHTQAAAFFRIALEQREPVAAAEEAELLELLAAEYYLTDRLSDAISASERAMVLRERSEDDGGVSGNHHALAVYQWYNANRDMAEDHAVAAVAVLGDEPEQRPEKDRGHLGHAIAMQSYLAVQASDLERARALTAKAAEVAAAVDDPLLSVRVRLIQAICDVHGGATGGREKTLSILATQNDRADENDTTSADEIYSSGYSNLSYFDVEQRRFRQAEELLGLSLPHTVERDLPICRVWQMGSRGRLKLMQGRWDEAVADAESVLSGPSAPLARTWPYLVRGLVTLRRVGGADADLDEAWALACRYGESIRLLPAAAALVERAWLSGVADDRLDECRSLVERTPRVGLEWARGELAAWLQRLDPDVELDVDGDDIAEPYRLQLDGDFEKAAAVWATLSAPYEQALAMVDAGGADNVRGGLDQLDRLGADDVAAKVRQDLRRRGESTIPSRRRAATLANPAGLTSRQIEILRLLGDGSTNAEIAQQLFISPKTVDHHVSALLTKLQVTRRRDAVRRGTELGIV